MKKILFSLLAGALLVTACRKTRDDVVSTVETVSYPTINFSGGQFYSINTGGQLPEVSATAYDSVLRESYSVSLTGTEALDNTTPGLYVVNATTKNRLGYITNTAVFVAVTNIDPSKDLSGRYKRVDITTGDISIVTKLANGLYSLDNIAGANRATRPDLLFPILFVQSDDTTMLIPPQEAGSFGTITVADTAKRADQAIVRQLPADTNYKYAITGPTAFFGGALRSFRKQ